MPRIAIVAAVLSFALVGSAAAQTPYLVGHLLWDLVVRRETGQE